MYTIMMNAVYSACDEHASRAHVTKFARAIGPETETDGVLEALIAGGTPPGKERGTNADDRHRHAYVCASRLAVCLGFPKALTHGRECCALS
jgi:hypothetical protein